jgi:hypothetical protein
MASVEDSYIVADGVVLWDDTIKPDGHVETAKVNEITMLFMVIMEMCLF